MQADKSLRYHAYVTGQYLNDIANDERTGLKFPPNTDPQDDDDEESSVPRSLLYTIPAQQGEASEQDGVTEVELFQEIAARIRSHLSDHIEAVRKKKEGQLELFASNDQPQFKPYLERAKGNLDRLNTRPTKRDIELALYEAKIDGKKEMDGLGRVD